MKCKICGAESGKYPLCRGCNRKKEAGEVIKCPICREWHYADAECLQKQNEEKAAGETSFLYELKTSLVTKTETEYLKCIQSVLPEECLLQTQANLASFIIRTDGARFQNELYRNVDFLITDRSYRPLVVIEINDSTHLSADRRERDKKVSDICGEAGIPIIKLWTSYGVNQEYIKKRIAEAINSLPIERVHHFVKKEEKSAVIVPPSQTDVVMSKKKEGCYIATCVYGSYDCPQVWTLRRFRDHILRKNAGGRVFINIYYKISPILVRIFGDKQTIKRLWKKGLDCLIDQLKRRGIADTPYTDGEEWQ